MSIRLVPLRPLASLVLALGCPVASVVHAQAARGAPEVREIRVPGKRAVARVWDERAVPHYSVSLDGQRFTAATATDYELRLRFGAFDPLAREPEVPAGLRASPGNRLHVVQCWTQVLEDWRAALREAGAEIHLFLANHAQVVEADESVLARVRAL